MNSDTITKIYKYESFGEALQFAESLGFEDTYSDDEWCPGAADELDQDVRGFIEEQGYEIVDDVINPEFKVAVPGKLPPKVNIGTDVLYVGLPSGWKPLMECVGDADYSDEDTPFLIKNGKELLDEYDELTTIFKIQMKVEGGLNE